MWFWVEKGKIRLSFQGQSGTKKRIFFFHKLMTSGQSGKKQIPSVTGNLAQMIVWVDASNVYVSERVQENGGGG